MADIVLTLMLWLLSPPVPTMSMARERSSSVSGTSVLAAKALARAANGKSDIVTTADPQVVKDAERIVLPGVGAFADRLR